MPILELCAGYGGLGMAAEALTGERIRYVAESDPHASRILAARYPDAPNLGDITSVDWEALQGEIDIVTAGFPCQGISNAGLRRGLADERSAVWFHALTAIRTLRPRFVFLENVAAIRRRGLPEVLGGLAAIGYDAKWCSFRASEIGAPHHRDRWFCLAVPEGSGAREEVAFDAQGGGEHRDAGAAGGARALPYSDSLRRSRGAGRVEEHPGRPELEDARYSPAAWWGDYLPAVRRWEDLTGRPSPAPTERGPRGGIRLTPAWTEWLMGLPAGWVTDVPGLGRKEQLRAIGNGVIPAQAFAAFHHLLQH
ncbi:DNA cytosine methyltransferase [Streptomyces sp. SID7810]|nr:DNA cytosine methyltransferase [Streptomyces sp. SID7810]CUW30093.1 Modification methylase HpaII [Streptomyces reticuli]